MDQSIVKTRWNEILDQIDDWWEELTDDDLEQINGSHIQLVYVLQERYGYTHEVARAEVERRIGSLNIITETKADHLRLASAVT
jgi:uncharacterized protein YjbJ (UPF0337 family)